MSMAYAGSLSVGGFPAFGAGAELCVAVSQAGGAATKGYVGYKAARPTWIRQGIILSASSASQEFFCFRQITGAAVLGVTPFVMQGSRTAQGQIIGGADQTVLGPPSPQLIWNFPLSFTGQFNFAGSNFLGPGLVLQPGDALVAMAGTVNINASLTLFLVEL